MPSFLIDFKGVEMKLNINERTRHIAATIPGLILALVAMFPSTQVLAEDGRLEINQTCAANDGCFAGDTPGYPVQITSDGSYVLTSGLNVPVGSGGLDLSVGNVTIDLNGFSIIGPETCNNTPVTDCTGSGFQYGISASSSGVTVKNGKVKGFTGEGVGLGDRATVIGVRAEQNGSTGIFLGANSLVVQSQAERNGIHGIRVADRSVVRDSSTWGNGNHGIDTARYCVISNSTSSENGERGISTLASNTVRGVSVTENAAIGVLLFNGSSTLTDSSVTGNVGFGVKCQYGGGSGLDNVVMNFNNSNNAQWDGLCNELGGNLCQNSTTCP
jgi:hypothetical protein